MQLKMHEVVLLLYAIYNVGNVAYPKKSQM